MPELYFIVDWEGGDVTFTDTLDDAKLFVLNQDERIAKRVDIQVVTLPIGNGCDKTIYESDNIIISGPNLLREQQEKLKPVKEAREKLLQSIRDDTTIIDDLDAFRQKTMDLLDKLVPAKKRPVTDPSEDEPAAKRQKIRAPAE